jgi:hypothetical protein
MKGRAGASVINVASISGWSPQLAMSGQYGAAKAALIFDTERWALEFVPHGIRVNTVSPGSILVAGNGWDRYRLANQEYFDDYVRHGFPMGRLGTAEEVADVIAFVASPRAHWINGRNIPVDGLEQPHAPWIGGHFSIWRGMILDDPYRCCLRSHDPGRFDRSDLGPLVRTPPPHQKRFRLIGDRAVGRHRHQHRALDAGGTRRVGGCGARPYPHPHR